MTTAVRKEWLQQMQRDGHAAGNEVRSMATELLTLRDGTAPVIPELLREVSCILHTSRVGQTTMIANGAKKYALTRVE